ncbi:hypothetical protein COOONC_27879, partial [Cooperia oncophora]
YLHRHFTHPNDVSWSHNTRIDFRSKKSRGWRTFLVVPELDHELTVWTDRRPLFEQLTQLDNTLADIYKHLDASSKSKPQIHSVLQQVKCISHEMDQEYGVLGSLFRAGSRTTFFACQVERYFFQRFRTLRSGNHQEKGVDTCGLK